MKKSGWILIGLLLCLVVACGGGDGSVSAAHDFTTVFIVRHAEKAVGEGDDPNLSQEGQQRAQRLGWMLSQAGVTHLYATQYKRTQQTLQPLAEQSHLEIAVIQANDLAGLVDRVRRESRGGTAAIAGHSNTVPMIIRELGVPNEIVITEEQYDGLFVVTLQGDSAHLIRLKF